MSVVGNRQVVESFSKIVPSKNFILSEKSGVSEVRWNGQNAFRAALWIFKDSSLPHTNKYKIWKKYEEGLENDKPRWYKHIQSIRQESLR